MNRALKPIRIPACMHRFEISGLNLERFLNLMQKESIPLCSVSRRDGRTLLCECFSADLPQLKALAVEKGWRIANERAVGLSGKLHWLRRRPGVLAGLVIAVLMVCLSSQFIWRVEVTGAGAYRAEIETYLSQSGYRFGKPRNTVDARALEQALLYRYPELTWFQVRAVGMTLFVDVSPGVSAPPLLSNQPGDLTARRGGVVVSVRTFAGTAQVKPGDVVTAGQVLIQGSERTADGETVPVQARGIVLARCWEQHTVTLPVYDIQSEETGRETHFWRIHTPLWQQPIPGADYLAYNTYVTAMPLVGAFFPVQVQRVTQREVSMQYVPRDMHQVQNEAAQAALQELKNKHFGDEIIDKWVDYCMIEDGSLAATATVEWLMDIGGAPPP